MNIVTGYRGEAHITAQQDRDTNRGIFGSGAYILPVGSEMEATIADALTVSIADGVLVCEGCVANIATGMTDSITVTAAGSGYNQNHLICAYYRKASGVESLTWQVISGGAYTGAPSADSDPYGYDEGSIADGDNLIYFPVFRVIVQDYAIYSITKLVSTPNTTYGLTTALSALTSTVDGKTPKFVFSSQDDWYNKMATISTYVPFMFRGEATFTNELFDVGSGSYSSWGIGMKFGSGGYHFLFICNHNLYYHVTTSSSATTYHPLNLKTNI